jgi:ATP-dependent exoDNAse (exonuclease V) beta subunit
MSTPRNANITFISAGAGSGKTHRLTELLQEELTVRAVRPAGVIATTFTRKAAAELRARVRAHLLQQGRFALANAMGQARIGTVNSVCGQLVARFAFEAGLSVEQQVLEEAQAALLLDRAIDAVLDGPQMDTLLALAERLGLRHGRNGDQEEWKAALQNLVNQLRSNDIPLDQLDGLAKANADALLGQFPSPAHEDLDAALLQAIRVAMPQLEAVAVAGNKKNTAAYLALVKDFKRELERKAAPWGGWVKLSKSAPEASLRTTVEPLSALAGRVAEHAGLHADLRAYLGLMFTSAGRALVHYQAVKQEMGTLDFADQEHQLLGLLDHPEVAAVLEDELDLLMVDEFQDTSPIQLALFLKLARFAKRVVWVGDIKQAIYGFRGSDTALMQSILAALPALGGRKEVLPASWRSRPELVKLVNAVFSHAFTATLPPEEVALKPTRNDDLPGAVLANWLLGGKNIDEEGSALAAGVRRLVDSGHLIHDKARKIARPVRYGDIALLAASHERVKTWGAALSAQGVPVATARPGLLMTPEATLALACLRRLNDPGDTLASAEIVSLTDCADPEQWVADRLRYLATGAAQDLWREVAIDGHPAHPVLETLRNLRTALPVLAPREALATVMAACTLSEKVLGWRSAEGAGADHARMRLANLEALLALAEQYEALCRSGQQAASVSGLILWLDEVAGRGLDLLAEPAIDAVKLMTHHAAKGLEWPVVVLTDLAKDIKDRLWSISAHTSAPFDANQPLAARFIRYWPWPFGPQQKVAVADAIALTDTAAEFAKAAIEEEKRLLYVSMTRARDLLVLARSSRKPSGPWLDALEAPWLLPGRDEEGDLSVLRLPTGETVRAERWVLEPADVHAATPADEHATLYGFPLLTRASVPLPLHFNPSTAHDGRPVSVVDRCCIGERIPIVSGVDMSALGTAIHACLALSFTDPGVPLTEGEVCRVLEGFGVREHVPAADVLRQINALHAWIHGRWPGVRAHAEFPVQSVMSNGQNLNGRIDLLLEATTGWVLIDHKSSPLPAERWEMLAAEHGPQLSSYARALERATGRAVQEAWLFLPVAGGGLALGFG